MPRLDDAKYHNAVLYFIKYCNNGYLGATKLNKLLYYLDFVSFRDKGKSVTGDLYIHLDFGPVPENAELILSQLKEGGFISAEIEHSNDRTRHRFGALKDPDLGAFDQYEKELLVKICKEFESWSTDKIVEQTHLEAPWFYSKPYDAVDYGYAKDIDFFA